MNSLARKHSARRDEDEDEDETQAISFKRCCTDFEDESLAILPLFLNNFLP